jgi:hypothetical protein
MVRVFLMVLLREALRSALLTGSGAYYLSYLLFRESALGMSMLSFVLFSYRSPYL